MSDAIFLPDDFTETLEIEAKLAQGRDGNGELPLSFWETYSAFANTQGGTFFLGVREDAPGDFVAVGIQNVERVEADLWNLLNNRQKVSHNLLQEHHVRRHPLSNDKCVLIVEVPRAPRTQRPVFIGSDMFTGTYKRNRSGDYQCAREEVERMVAERVEESRDTRILPNFGFDDLVSETITAYRQRLAGLKPDHPFNSQNARDFLKSLGAWGRNRETKEEGLTVAGLLMFGSESAIREACPHYFVDYRELPVSGSKTEWVDRLTPDGTWSGNLYDFYRLVITRLFRDLKVPLAISKDQREDDTPLHKALREALVNALVHADYTERASVLIVKAPDYFGFRNPGNMRVSIEDAMQGGKSDCRNRTLQRMFSICGLGEQAGSGIPRIVKNWDDLSFRRPELWEDTSPPATLMRLRTVSLLPTEAIEELRFVFGSRFDQLPETDKLALVTAQVEGFVSNRRLQEVCRDHPYDITKMLRRLVDSDFLVPDGFGRATTYRVWGEHVPDLALLPQEPGGDPFASALRSPDKDLRSPHNGPRSPHKESSSPHSGTTSDHLVDENSARWNDLMAQAEEIRRRRRTDPEITRAAILSLCEDCFLTTEQFGKLLGLQPKGIRDRFLTPLFNEGKLERRFPHTPNHEQQAYRRKD
jgi:predicted HTH transcriptional regulator